MLYYRLLIVNVLLGVFGVQFTAPVRGGGGDVGERHYRSTRVEANSPRSQIILWALSNRFLSIFTVISIFYESSMFSAISSVLMPLSRFTFPSLLVFSLKSAVALRDIPGDMLNGFYFGDFTISSSMRIVKSPKSDAFISSGTSQKKFFLISLFETSVRNLSVSRSISDLVLKVSKFIYVLRKKVGFNGRLLPDKLYRSEA
jgi:hypothetical protein